MGIDELKLVLQALAGLADGAKEGFIWWLVIEGAMPKLLLSLFGAGILGTGIYIARLVAKHAALTDTCQKGIKEIARLAGVSFYRGNYVSSSEVQHVVDAVEKMSEHKRQVD